MKAKTVLLQLMAASAALVVGCKSAPSAPPPGPPEVAIVTVQPERIVLTTELPGRTAPHLVAEIRPQVNGILRERRFEEGADVRSGDLLYQIDPAPYRAAVEQAEAALAMAEANLPAARLRSERLDGLVAIRAVGKQDGDDATAALRQAEAAVAASRAALESAKINLAYTPIRAPISGRIGKSSVTVGALVTAYQPVPLAVIQQLDPIFVDVPQSSADLLRLRRALSSGTLTREHGESRKVRLVLEDGVAYPFEGTLAFRDVTVDPATGSVSLRMVFPNPETILLPGMFVRAIVEEGVRENAVTVPQQAVTRDPRGNATALVVGADDTVAERKLTLDRAIGDRWLIVDGLAGGDRVIVEGMQRVRPGASVRAVPFADAAK
jgi:membrane fusion protein, multidrug efflux system